MTNEEILGKLKQLQADTTDIIRKLVTSDQRVPGSINWGQLGCAEVHYVTTLRGSHFEVVIEEAAPDAIHLQVAVSVALKQKGWEDVSIRTEW